MTLLIRPAAQADMAVIAQIAATTFAEGILPQRDHLRSNFLLVAEWHGAVVGFAASFLTRSAAGTTRFELDLLAVDAAARGRGVGSGLVARCIQTASASGADSLRALARTDNLVMSRIGARAGLLRSACAYDLYIAEATPMNAPASIAHAAHLVPVDTLTYRGIWLEGGLSQAAVDLAHHRAQSQQRSRIGALVPVADAPVAALLTKNGFVSVGEFCWWSLRL
ncbi:MAG: GNAT family N-acetyltransferase [Chloroflexi bacterium]|nr:GNAT family N-acetyltransferase [Chloroflexota bacterium]MCY4248503.1 GNAT family N-acetyltransferase [Chloroflexota bacterium]